MTELRREYEGALEARLVAAAAAKDASAKMQQRAEAAEAALSSARLENDGLRGSLATVRFTGQFMSQVSFWPLKGNVETILSTTGTKLESA
jgi:hypothetical protein